MTNPSSEEQNEARKALQTIVSDPVYGVPALSSSQTMANLLKDLLPDAPREVSILVAAAEADVATNLQDRISQGMDVGTASAVVAGAFAARTPFKPEACTWAVSEMAVALGLDSSGQSAPQGTSRPGDAADAVTAKPQPAPGAFQPGGYQPGAAPQGGYAPPGAAPQAGASPQGGHAPPGASPQAGASPQGGYAPPGASPQGGYAPPGASPQAGESPQGGYAPPGAAPQGGYAPSTSPQGGYQPGDYRQAAFQQGGYQQGDYRQGGYPQGGYSPTGQAPPPAGYPAGSPQQGNVPGAYQPPPGPGYWPQQQPGYTPTARTNGPAIASLVLGLLWIFWLGSLAGLILGLVALKQIKARNERGRGIAIAGIVLSALGLAGFILLIIIGATHSTTSGT